MKRIDALTGVRACAVILVLFDHSKYTWHSAAPILSFVGLYLGNGELGVEIFFVLSGFLITSLLFAEKAKTGTIDMGQFYLRRVRRILPAFYVWIAVMAVLSFRDVIRVASSDLISTALFVKNYVPGPHGWWTANAWTLCIEEWFYVGFPALALYLGRRRLVAVLCGIVALEPAVRLIQFTLTHEDAEGVSYQIHTRLDTIAIGCLLAIALRDERARAWFASRRADFVALGAAVLIFFIVPTLDARLPHHMLFKYGLGFTSDGIGAALIVGYLTQRPASLASRVLSLRPFVWLGTISYSLYLWQQLWLTKFNPTPWPLNLAGALVCACLSYYLIEQPILDWSRRGVRAEHKREMSVSR